MSPTEEERVLGRRAYGGVLVVPCLLNDTHRYWLLADTGAALTTVSREAAEEMGLDLLRPLRQEPIASVHRMDWAPVIRLNSLQVSGQRVTDLEVLILSLPPDLRIDGLLGVNFLHQFRPTFEFDQATLILR